MRRMGDVIVCIAWWFADEKELGIIATMNDGFSILKLKIKLTRGC
jgi:hypothetical protein